MRQALPQVREQVPVMARQHLSRKLNPQPEMLWLLCLAWPQLARTHPTWCRYRIQQPVHQIAHRRENQSHTSQSP